MTTLRSKRMGGLGSPLPGGRRKGEIDVDAMRSAIAASIERGRAGKQLEDTVKAIGNKAALFDLLIEMQHMDGDSTYAFSYMFVTGSEDIWANRGTKGVQFTYPTIIDGHKQDRETTVTLNVETDENGFDSVREDFKKIREWEAARKTFEKERIEFIDTLTDRQRELMNLPKKR